MNRRSRPVAKAKTRVKTARGRKTSSTRWLQRQLNDPYVAEAKTRGYRSRAAFKLIGLDDKFGLLRPGMRVVDLGAAPGGWTQVVVERAAAASAGRKGRHDSPAGNEGPPCVVAADQSAMEPLIGAAVLMCDLASSEAPDMLRQALGAAADLVLSDMSPATTGHPPTDHLRIIALAESAYTCARELLSPGGGFVVKVFQGGAPGGLLELLKRDFSSVRHFKPPASRKESPETYVVALGFRGAAPSEDD